mmetsp:Transcript_45750/g.83800  ORF Transcript_45750/g.83800 Transcript_45750/m.83800 type:complete len:510 (+) Transcript_45750:152-1681(+)
MGASSEHWSDEWRNTSHFHEHVGFLALMLVCAACAIHLMGVLEPIVRPFLWALFLVMGLQPAVSFVERALLRLFTLVCGCSVGFLALCVKVCTWLDGKTSLCTYCKCTKRWAMRNLPHKNHRSSSKGSPLPGTLIGSSHEPVPTHRLVPTNPAEDHGHPGHGRRLSQSGRRRKALAHFVAVTMVVAGVCFIVSGTTVMLVQSALSLKHNWDVYEKGASQLINSVEDVTTRWMLKIPEELAEEIATDALAQAEALVSAFITEVLSNCGRIVFELLMMALYIAFWLSDPVPVSTDMEDLFRRYLILKGTACLGYGICVTVCLQALNIDLAVCFGFMAFCLSFVPEVGPIFAVVLPAPVILLDSRLHSPALTLMTATMMQLGLKLFFANVVEVKLVEADEVMKMHPVVILLMVALFGYIWGPTGMLLSVPLVAYLKVALLSDSVPACYRDPILVFLEGDRMAPRRHSERLRMERAQSQQTEDDDAESERIGSRDVSRASGGVEERSPTKFVP